MVFRSFHQGILLMASLLVVIGAARAEVCQVKIDGLPQTLGPTSPAEDVYTSVSVKIVDEGSSPDASKVSILLNGTLTPVSTGKVRNVGANHYRIAIDLRSAKESLREGNNSAEVRYLCSSGNTVSSAQDFLFDSIPPKIKSYANRVRVSDSQDALVYEVSSWPLGGIIGTRTLNPQGGLKLAVGQRIKLFRVFDKAGNAVSLRFDKRSGRWRKLKNVTSSNIASNASVVHSSIVPLSLPAGGPGCQNNPGPIAADTCALRISLKIPYFEIVNNAIFTAVNKAWAEEQLLWFTSQVIPAAGSKLSYAISNNGYPMPLNLAQIVSAELLALPVIIPATQTPPIFVNHGDLLNGKWVPYGNSFRYSTILPEQQFPLFNAMSAARCDNTVEIWVVDSIPHSWGKTNPLDGTVVMSSVLSSSIVPAQGLSWQPNLNFSADILAHELGHIVGLGHFIYSAQSNIMFPWIDPHYSSQGGTLEFFQARAAVAHLCGPVHKANFMDLYNDKYINEDYTGDHASCGNGMINDREECETNTTKYQGCLDFSSPRPQLDQNAFCRPDTCTCAYLTTPPIAPPTTPNDNETNFNWTDYLDYLNQCENQAAPSCNGECPEGKTCSDEAGKCKCIDKVKSCEASEAPACGGECPPGQSCSQSPSGACACGSASCGEADQCRSDSDCPLMGGPVPIPTDPDSNSPKYGCAMYKGKCKDCRCVYPIIPVPAGEETTCSNGETGVDAFISRGFLQN